MSDQVPCPACQEAFTLAGPCSLCGSTYLVTSQQAAAWMLENDPDPSATFITGGLAGLVAGDMVKVMNQAGDEDVLEILEVDGSTITVRSKEP